MDRLLPALPLGRDLGVEKPGWDPQAVVNLGAVEFAYNISAVQAAPS